jgi:subtilisin family serine protease
MKCRQDLMGVLKAAGLFLMVFLMSGRLVAGGGDNGHGNGHGNRHNIVQLSARASLSKFLQRSHSVLVNALSDGSAALIASDSTQSPDQWQNSVQSDPDVDSVELDTTLVMSENTPQQSAQLAQSTVALLNQSTVALLNQSTVALLNDTTTVNYFGANVRTAYAEQPALALIRNDQAHKISTGLGVVVADIDTGVDPNNPALINSLVDGYNFIDGNADTSEWNGLDQSTVALLNQNSAFGLDQSTVSLLNQSTVSLLNQSTVSLLNQSTVSLLNQSTVALLNQSTVGLLNQSTVALLNQSTVALLNQSTVSLLNQLPPAFGHGTMVAGLIHVVAPNAKLMPIIAFQPDGTGTLFNVVQAIRYATDQGADVINMSFSFSKSSSALKDAIKYARSRGVTLISSVGNDGVETDDNFPADYSGVAGIAATDNNDMVAPFSNYGKKIVDYTAPGVGLVTLFPGGHYAMVNGTSFSSALASGLAALCDSVQPSNYGRVFSAMDRGAVNIDWKNRDYKHDLGQGRIDAVSSLFNILSQDK